MIRSNTEDNLDNNGQNAKDGIPGFEITIAFFAIIIFLYSKNKK